MRLALHGATRCNPWIVLRKLWIAADPRFAQDNPWIVPDPRFAQNIDVPSAKREGVYFGFQGDLNLVDTENPSSKVFRP